MTGRRLLWPLLPLFGLSLLVLGSLSWQLALNQGVFIILGLGLFVLVSNYPYSQHRFFSRQYLGLIIFLLLLPYIFGVTTRGAVRWIPLGSFSLQPSELVKPLLIIIFAAYLSASQKLGGYLLLLLLPFGLIFKQPDLGTSLVVGVIWLGLLFNSRVDRRQIFGFLGVVLISFPLIFRLLQPYQKERLTGFVNPYADPAGSGYQVIQALIAVGGGGWLGQGLGRGSQSQLQFLPERQTDFIFSAITEELGVAAGAVLLLSYLWLLRRLLVVAGLAADEFGRLVVTGVIIMLWFQAVVTIGMNLGMMPVTGITLPLVSAGGSSLLSIMISLGLVGSVWKFSQSGL
ncbi:rod shape-determining protein RodA [Candidatus Beckwithbacteria bacterium CG_4_9_14_0_2_um_filter_47_11]|uniref:Probable peptidoglycan glycosyltransferase FtsW n=1 Tax=Candidatus Beckwithbacteria bacterium CG_4_9_14_0_2_um_filter_47_11 TaxID=1974494 RepID=A0A2M8G3E1_9BACT|nr:MAG: rod shape-determining protein RodA [Candidatus Beckwithbacteria bacterium CG_4_9_14_0_2_um_filter_47_11]